MYRNINEESNHIRQKNGYCWLKKLSHASHQTWLTHNGCKAAARSEILKKVQPSIRIKLLVLCPKEIFYLDIFL